MSDDTQRSDIAPHQPPQSMGVLFHQALNKRREKKNAKLEKILQAATKGSITNDDVQILVAVSDRTARNYLQELVRQGKLKATAQRGRGVAYVKG